MMKQDTSLNVAIVGGGSGCKAIMDIIFAKKLHELRMKLVGVACTNPKDVGYRYARKKGIYTTRDYRDLYKLKDLNMIIELTGREEVAHEIVRTKPDHVRLMDNVAARFFRDVFKIVEERNGERRRATEALLESEEKYKTLVENSLTGIFIHQDGKYVFVNNRFAEIHGYTHEELLGKEYLTLISPDERDTSAQIASARLRGEGVPQRYEVQRLGKDGKTIWCEMMATRIEYGGRPAIMGNIIDITKRKLGEELLQESFHRLQIAYDQSIIYAEQLSEQITERKRAEEALRQRKEELKAQAQNLVEVNTALKVLLKRREEDKTELEEKILSNVKELVLPYIKALRNTRLDVNQIAYAGIIESHLNNIISPFLQRLSSKYLGLTPREIQVAGLIKEGKITKEIAGLLNVSQRAVEFHRENIRAKLGLKNKKANLRSYLLSLL